MGLRAGGRPRHHRGAGAAFPRVVRLLNPDAIIEAALPGHVRDVRYYTFDSGEVFFR